MITENLKKEMLLARWIRAHRIDSHRLLILRYWTDNTLPYSVHYYFPESEYYEMGLYNTDDKVRAYKTFNSFLKDHEKELKERLCKLNDILLNLLVKVEQRDIKKLKAVLQPEIEKAELEIKKCKEDLESLATDLTGLVAQNT